MIKRLMYVALAFGMVFGLFGQVDKANAEKKIGECTIIIDANKNHYKKGNLATLTGDKGCKELGDYYRYYGKYQEEGFFVGAKKVKNGEKIVVSNPLGFEFDKYIIKVKTNNQGSQQSQSTSNQTSQPKQNNTTSKSKESTKNKQQSQSKQTKSKNTESKQQTQSKQSSQSKQTSQPKQNNTTQSKQTSQPKQNNTTVKQTTNQVAQNIKKEETKTLQAKGDEQAEGDEQEKNKKENDKDKKDEKLSVDELKDKNAKVVKENGKFYALYKDEKGKDVKQEISEEEAKGLGYKEKVETVEPVKEETEETPVEKKEDDDKKSSKTGVIAGTVAKVFESLGNLLRRLFHL